MSWDYVASPYTHPDPATMWQRYYDAKRYVAWALDNGIWCYSPIVHCHELAVEFNLPKDFQFWKAYNSAMLSGAARMRILMLDGWQESQGIHQVERPLAQQLSKEIYFVTPEEIQTAIDWCHAQKAG